MKSLLIIFYLLCYSAFSFAQNKTGKNIEKELNIRQYWLVMIKTGPQDSVIRDSARRADIFKGHFANMGKLHKEGILKVAGPFGKNDLKWRGLFILECATKDDAEKIVSTDPAIAAGIFVTDIVPWFTEPSGSFEPGKPKVKKEERKR